MRKGIPEFEELHSFGIREFRKEGYANTVKAGPPDKSGTYLAVFKMDNYTHVKYFSLRKVWNPLYARRVKKLLKKLPLCCSDEKHSEKLISFYPANSPSDVGMYLAPVDSFPSSLVVILQDVGKLVNLVGDGEKSMFINRHIHQVILPDDKTLSDVLKNGGTETSPFIIMKYEAPAGYVPPGSEDGLMNISERQTFTGGGGSA